MVEETAMNRWYSVVSTLAMLPLSIYSLFDPDLRRGLWRRYRPEPMRPPDASARLWVHAASAGEVRLADAFARRFLERQPDSAFLLTVDTQAGLASATGGPWSFVRYFPFDAYPCLCRMFDQFRPHAVIQVEMELWPGLLGMARERGAPVAVINARMRPSETKAFARFNRSLHDYLSIPYYLARSDDDVAILRRLQVPEKHLLVTGEMKIEHALERGAGTGPRSKSALLAVSTHPGEERVVLDAFRRLRNTYPALKAIVAPRHPRRAGAVARMALREGWKVRVIEEGFPEVFSEDVVVEGGWGRMEFWYGFAAAAFVGGTLVTGLGGHNVLEPVLHGVPAITGPYHEDWIPWVKLLREAGALSVVWGEGELARAAQVALEEDLSPGLEAARQRLRRHEGATMRNAETVLRLLDGRSPVGHG